MELILDASSSSARVGIAFGGQTAWTTAPLSPLEHTQELLPAILRGLDETHSAWSGLKLIVVALGPGPFNGLRVAVSTAKGLAAGTGADIVGIPTLQAEAHRCTEAVTVRPVVAAGRRAFATALYTRNEQGWSQVEEARLVDEDDRSVFLEEDIPLCGETERLAMTPPFSAAPLIPQRFAAVAGSRLDSLAALGWQHYVVRDITTMASLQPLYARPPHITTPRDRRP